MDESSKISTGFFDFSNSTFLHHSLDAIDRTVHEKFHVFHNLPSHHLSVPINVCLDCLSYLSVIPMRIQQFRNPLLLLLLYCRPTWKRLQVFYPDCSYRNSFHCSKAEHLPPYDSRPTLVLTAPNDLRDGKISLDLVRADCSIQRSQLMQIISDWCGTYVHGLIKILTFLRSQGTSPRK